MQRESALFHGLPKKGHRYAIHFLFEEEGEVTIGNATFMCVSNPGYTPGSTTSPAVFRSYAEYEALKAVTGPRVHRVGRRRQEESVRKPAGLNNMDMLFTAHTGFAYDFEKAMTEWRELVVSAEKWIYSVERTKRKKEVIMPFFGRQFRKTAPQAIDFILGNALLRKQAANYARRYMHRVIVEEDNGYTRNIRYERYAILSNLIVTVERALTSKNISPAVRKKLLDIFVGRIFLENAKEKKDDFVKEFGQDPPGFITISPGKKCNLQCTGCYAGSGAKSSEKLDYATVDRIVSEKTELWNNFFTVISGGEPMMWRSDGKGIIDLCRDHPDNYFLMYTNGTMIDRKMAKQMAEVGNITPAISVEGFKAETDERRGAGVYDEILDAMANLREVGVPFGISVTATRSNAEMVVSDEFVDFYFEKQGAVYGWMFQYMPIGRSITLDMMVTPEQRRWMFEREKHIIHDKHVFLPDFWNGGAFSEGCLAAGRPGGYIYIDWNGSVTPCVFYPYSKNNIKDIYARGGNLNDTLKSDLMVGIRKWQRDYGYSKTGRNVKNLIAPCGIRDHYEFTHKHILETKAVPIDPDAADAIQDPLFYRGLVDYNNKFMSMTEPIWQKEFIESDGDANSGSPGIKTQDNHGDDHSANGDGRLVENEEEVTIGK